jgi:hypothetical protein
MIGSTTVVIGSSLEEATDDLISHGRPDPQQTTWPTTYDRNHADDPNRADDRNHADDPNRADDRNQRTT